MFNNQFFQLNRIQHQIPWKGEKMKDKLSRLFACLIAVFMVIAMVGMSTAKAEDGAETPIATTTATATAEITDDPVIEVPEVEATEVNSAAKVEDKGEKPDAKPTKTPRPTSTATVEPTEDPTQTPTPTSTATVEPTEDPTEDPTDPPVVLPDTPVSECTNGVWTITITYPADAYGDANGAVLWYDGQWQEASGNLDPGESYTFEIRAGLNSLRLDWHGWASQYSDVSWELQRPSDCGSPSEPKPDPKSGEDVVSSDPVCLPEGGGTVTVSTTPWTQDWVLEDGKWVLGEVVYGETVETTRPATEQECPTPTKPTAEPTAKPTVKPTPSAPAEPTAKPTAKPTPSAPAEPTVKPTAKSSDDKKSDDRKGSPSTGVVDDDGGVQGVALAAAILVMSAAAAAGSVIRRKKN